MTPHPNTAASSWYQQSVAVIKGVLANVAPDTPLVLVDTLIFDAYPFGARENHPYRMWLKARKHMLAQWTGRQETKATRGPFIVLRRLPGDFPWLDVACDWCQSKGCLVCGSARERVWEAVVDPRFREFRKAVGKDYVGWLALCDWLQEYHGIEVEVPPCPMESPKEK